MTELEQLRKEVEKLRWRVEALEEALGLADETPPGMTGMEGRIYGLLKRHGYASYRRIYAAMWGDDPEAPEHHTMQVHICRIRKRLPPTEWIENIYEEGYRLHTKAA